MARGAQGVPSGLTALHCPFLEGGHTHRGATLWYRDGLVVVAASVTSREPNFIGPAS